MSGSLYIRRYPMSTTASRTVFATMPRRRREAVPGAANRGDAATRGSPRRGARSSDEFVHGRSCDQWPVVLKRSCPPSSPRPPRQGHVRACECSAPPSDPLSCSFAVPPSCRDIPCPGPYSDLLSVRYCCFRPVKIFVIAASIPLNALFLYFPTAVTPLTRCTSLHMHPCLSCRRPASSFPHLLLPHRPSIPRETLAKRKKMFVHVRLHAFRIFRMKSVSIM